MKWKVKVPAGRWMAGVHTFKTKRAASDFVRRWQTVEFGAKGRITALALWKEAGANW